jgi:hypothetical protein
MVFRPLVCWDCRFESLRWHGCLFRVSVVCCQVEVCATVWSLVQRRPMECDVSEYDRGPSYRRPRSPRVVDPWQKRWPRTPQYTPCIPEEVLHKFKSLGGRVIAFQCCPFYTLSKTSGLSNVLQMFLPKERKHMNDKSSFYRQLDLVTGQKMDRFWYLYIDLIQCWAKEMEPKEFTETC